MVTPVHFKESIREKKTIVGVIGLGYVGLPLVLEFARKGFKVVGLDIDEEKVESLKSGQSYIRHIPSSAIGEVVSQGLFTPTSDFSRSREADALLICVPTPLGEHLEPDLTYIENTARSIAPHLRPGQLVVLESTTYPGTTEEVLVPILENGSGLKGGKDFWVAFSPEREDPNNPDFTTATIPKVVGGINRDSLEVAQALYDQIVVRTVPVSSPAVAEACKLMENIFRAVNIALVNELKVIFTRMGIDIWEVIEAAKTKPFGFMPFYPGPGLGGHCIPIDPFYLTWRAREFGYPTRFIELAGEINTSMPAYVVQQTLREMNRRGRTLKGARVVVVGLAYKPDVDDMRESPSLRLMKLLEEEGAQVEYYDPFIPVIPPNREFPQYVGKRSLKWEEIEGYDVALISTKHSPVDHTQLPAKCFLVVDTRNALTNSYPNVVKA